MSDTDSFIDEVTEEVRRDRLYGYVRRYGWIAAIVIIGIVGAAGFNEYRRAQEEAKAQALGDAMLAALASDEDEARADALANVTADTAEGGRRPGLHDGGCAVGGRPHRGCNQDPATHRTIARPSTDLPAGRHVQVIDVAKRNAGC